MTVQANKIAKFRALHKKGDPLVLYNIWDAGGAKALSEAGAKAVATGSWSMAAAHGFEDGECLPLGLLMTLVRTIASASRLPLTVDFEGGYAAAPEQIGHNVTSIIQAGATGINFEDEIVQGTGLYGTEQQVARIAAARGAADQNGTALFINARTDLFLKADPSRHQSLVDEAIAREAAYKAAGADGFFVPGLTGHALIEKIVNAVSLPVNVMMAGELASIRSVADLGVSQVSYGPEPYLAAISDLTDRFRALT